MTTDSKRNVFIVTLYSFIPLEKKPKGKYKDLILGSPMVEPDRLIRYTGARFCVEELKDEGGRFFYTYNVSGKELEREVEMKVWLYKFISDINLKGRYYLVTTISIDKAFGDENKTPQFPFGLSNICTSEDIVQLKKAAYGGKDKGLFYKDSKKNCYLHNYLDDLIERITGKNPHGKYGRHYIVDVRGVGIADNVRIQSREHLTRLFSDEYYKREKLPFNEVVKDYKTMVYGLFFGNENNEVIPYDTLENTLKDSFSNNKTERLFAYHKTIVFLHTHHPYPWNPENVGKQKILSDEIEKDPIIWDAFLVMEARLKLKEIDRLLRPGQPQNIKDALASISSYLATNPYRLGEYGQRSKMLYRNMGIVELFNSIKDRGNLLADAKVIENNEKLNHRVYALTAVTVLVGVLSLIVSIICCNTGKDNPKTISNMYNCILESAGCMGGCCAVVGVLFGLVLSASIIVMAVYQVKSFYKLKDVENELNKINN